MGTFAAQSVYSNNPSPQTGAGLAALASNQEAIMELPGAQAPQSVEITDNALTFSTTPVSAYLVVDTEGQAAVDDFHYETVQNIHSGSCAAAGDPGEKRGGPADEGTLGTPVRPDPSRPARSRRPSRVLRQVSPDVSARPAGVLP